jgi:membrane protease YdiL (CAAX protease family)
LDVPISEVEDSSRGPAATGLALLLVSLPYCYAFWFHLSGREISLAELMLYPLLIGGAGIALILCLIRYLFRERIGGLNRKPGRWHLDGVAGLLLTALSFATMVAHGAILAPLLPRQSGPPPQSVELLLSALRENPLLLALWLGPVVWIGVAAFEELSRVFLLDRLWKLWPRTGSRWFAILLSAVAFGLVHIYQGLAAVVSISLLGLLYGLYYLRFGRVWPLIIAHALFDSLQILQAVT